MALSQRSVRQQLRGYLELEKLFGSSELLVERSRQAPVGRVFNQKIAPEEVKKEEISHPQYDLLVLFADVPTDPQVKEILNKMLKTLEIGENQLFVTSLRHNSVDDLIRWHRPKCLLAMGSASEALKVNDFSKVFSRQLNNIHALGTWSPEHLLQHAEDKKHSWETLLLLKSLLKS